MERVTVPEAAERLGLSENAIRKRIQRNTITWERDEEGRVYVYLSEAMTDYAADHDGGHDNDKAADQAQLIERMAGEIDFLRGELQRKDAILLSMSEGLKALEPLRDERGSTETPGEERGGSETPEDQERPSWWRRFFGFPS